MQEPEIIDELVEQIALRARHNAAMEIVAQFRDFDERVGLLCSVVWPREAVAAISRLKAEVILEERLRRGYYRKVA